MPKSRIANENEVPLTKGITDELSLKKGFDRLINFEEDEPADILGPHLWQTDSMIVRAYLPKAVKAWLLPKNQTDISREMEKVHPGGLFQVILPRMGPHSYRIRMEDALMEQMEFDDPYAFPHSLTDFDLHLLGEGTHYQSYEKFGARPTVLEGVKGVTFVLWAPNAKAVSVVGDFNYWRPGAHPMNRARFSGLWTLFIPDLKVGDLYKFAIKTQEGYIHLKSDPYGFHTELRPQTACRVADLSLYQWKDSEWLEKRRSSDSLNSPVSVYEVHLGSWRREEKRNWGFMTYRELADQLVRYVKEMGYTHIELLPVMEHPLDESWGYQVVNFFAPTSRFGTPQDFMYFVDTCHQNGIGVMIDWVPGHFPKDAHGLANFDGQEIYGYQSWKKREHKDWGTFVFDYGRKEVRNFLISNALFWIDKYHIDGLRVDAVASMLYLDYSRRPGEWEPNMFGGNENLEAIEFLKKFNETLHLQFPGVLTIAEESTAWGGVSRPTYLGGLGFSMKWNMGWMHDSLEYFSKDPIYRKWHHGMLTFSLLYAFAENFVLPISHDEVVYGKRSLLEKMPGDDWQKFANLRLFFAYMFTHPGKKLMIMGSELAQRQEWNCLRSLDWHLLHYAPHQQIQQTVKDLNRIYRETPALYELDFDSGGFEWIDFSDSESGIVSYLRWSKDRRQVCVIALNMTPVPRSGYRIGVPRIGHYTEVFNTDAVEYGGSGVGNAGGFFADLQSWHGRPFSLNINIPPLGAVLFRQDAEIRQLEANQ